MLRGVKAWRWLMIDRRGTPRGGTSPGGLDGGRVVAPRRLRRTCACRASAGKVYLWRTGETLAKPDTPDTLRARVAPSENSENSAHFPTYSDTITRARRAGTRNGLEKL